MRKLLLGFALMGCSLAMPMMFADDCCYLPQCEPYCCGDNFEGAYLGGNLGVFSHVAHRNDVSSGFTSIDTNFTAGVQLGYDWQWGNRLAGLVADWNWVNTRNRHRNITNDGSTHSDFHWFTTIRARAGLAVCDALVYVTGGAAVARFKTRWDTPFAFNDHHTRWGWTGGVGAEMKLWCNWSIGAEVLYIHFSERHKDFVTQTTTPARLHFSHSDSSYVGRILLNYRFGDLFCFN